MDLLTALVNRPFFLGKVATSSALAPATIVPEGCTVYVTDEDKVYISLNSEWKLLPSDRPEDIISYSTYYTNKIKDYFLTVTKKRADSTLYYESKLYYYPSVTIVDDGILKITLNTLYSIPVENEFIIVDDSIESIRSLTVTRDTIGSDNTLNILLEITEDEPARAIIGGVTPNGHIDVIVNNYLGSGGNDYTYEVDATSTTVRPLSVTFVDGNLVIYLKVVEDTAATAIIGGATVNGHIDMEIDGGLGAVGNDYTVTVVADLDEPDLVIPASVDLTGTD